MGSVRRPAAALAVGMILLLTASADAKVKLAFTTDWPAAQFKQFVVEFEKRHPTIDVAMTAASSPEKIWTQIAAGIAPDVLYVRGTDAQTYIQSGILEPLDKYIKSDKVNMADFVTAGLKPYKDKSGGVFVLPYDWCPVMTFYNRDHLSAAGIPPIGEGFTTADLAEYANKLRVANAGKTTRWGLSAGMNGWMFEGTWLKAFGGHLFNDDESQVLVTEKAAIAGLTFAQRFWADKLIGGSFPKTASMTFAGTWEFKAFVKLKDAWDIGPLPKGPVDYAGTAMGSGYAISKGSKHKREAWTFVNELMGPMGMELVWAPGTTPSRRSGLRYFRELYSKYSVKYVEPQAEHSWAGTPLMPPGEMTMNTVTDPIFGKLTAGTISPEQAAQSLKNSIEALWKSRRRKK